MSKTIGKAKVKLNLDDKGLIGGLQKAQRKLKKFGSTMQNIGKSFAVAGLAMGAPLLIATKIFVNLGDKMDKMSKRTGFSVASLSALRFAAEQSGTDVEKLEIAIKSLANVVDDAKRGILLAVDAFARLGFSVDDLNNKSPEVLFNEVAIALSKIEDPLERAALAMDVFGAKAGQKLLPMLGDIQKLTAEAKKLGIVMSDDDTKAAAKLTDQFNVLRKQLEMVAVKIGAVLMPKIMEISKEIQDILPKIITWIKENKDLVIKAGMVAVALGGLATAFFTVGIAAGVASSAIGAFAFIAKGLMGLGIVAELGHWGAGFAFAVSKAGGLAGILSGINVGMLGIVAIGAAKFIAIAVAIGAVGKAFYKLGETISKTFVKYTGLAALLGVIYKVKQTTNEEAKAGLNQNARGKKTDEQIKEKKIKDAEKKKPKQKVNNEDIETAKEVARINLGTEREKLKLRHQGLWLQSAELDFARDKAIKEAAGNEKVIAAIKEQYKIKQEILAATEKAAYLALKTADAEQKAAELKEKQENIALATADQKARIADLELENSYEGFELEKKKLELAKERALLEAKDAGVQKSLIENEFDLRNEMLNKQEIARQKASAVPDVTTSKGSFATGALQRIFNLTGIKSKAETATIETAKNTGKMVSLMENCNPGVFS